MPDFNHAVTATEDKHYLVYAPGTLSPIAMYEDIDRATIAARKLDLGEILALWWGKRDALPTDAAGWAEIVKVLELATFAASQLVAIYAMRETPPDPPQTVTAERAA